MILKIFRWKEVLELALTELSTILVEFQAFTQWMKHIRKVILIIELKIEYGTI